MIRVRCYTCQTIFDMEHGMLYDNGTNMAVVKCPHCGTLYLLTEDEKHQVPLIFKLSRTKATVIMEEKSRIIKPAEAGLILMPGDPRLRGMK